MDRQHIVEVPAYFFILRVAQIVLSVFVFALSAASIGLLHGYYYLSGPSYAIFVSLVSIIICAWYIFSTRLRLGLYHRIPVLVFEVFLEIWWLSCWITLAWWAAWAGFVDWSVIYGDGTYYVANTSTAVHGTLGAAAFFAAVNWVLFTVTLVTFVIRFLRHQRNRTPNQGFVPPTDASSSKLESHQMQPQPAPTPGPGPYAAPNQGYYTGPTH